ncbi:hypothetical protein P7C73_g1482, partial [Tremellales sp. Uapishka_1]
MQPASQNPYAASYSRSSVSTPLPSPYPRKDSRSLRGIHLPIPNSSAPLNIEEKMPPHRGDSYNPFAPPSSSSDPPHHYWKNERPERHYQLPPLHESISRASSPPLPTHPPAASMRPPRLYSPRLPSPEPYRRPSFGPSPHTWREDDYQAVSPPLRTVHQAQASPYSPRYDHRRRGSHSSGSGFSKAGARPLSPEEDPRIEQGQNRRLAHLMSEQKRRESINKGFQTLRDALPSAIPTDSKAIVLRKAVTHIQQLESLLAKAGLMYPGSSGQRTAVASPTASGSVGTTATWDVDLKMEEKDEWEEKKSANE